MKFTPLNITSTLYSKLESGKVKAIDLRYVESFISVFNKKFTTHFIFSEIHNEKLYTYIIYVYVDGEQCSTEVKATKFNSETGKDGSYVPYGGGNKLTFSIDTEDDIIYYLSEIAVIALNEYIITCM